MEFKNEYKKHQNGLYLPFAENRQQGRINPKVVKVVEGFKDRSRKDIQKWRRAIQMANLPENPRFQEYHDLVDDLLTDGHLQSQIQMRIAATLNTDFHIINRKTGEENEELTFVFQQQWFFELLEIALWQIIRGFKLIEFQSFAGEKIEIQEIPQRHLVPTKNKIILDLSDYDTSVDFSLPELEPWLLPIGKPNNLGLINNVIPAIIWKRNVTQSWAEFCERFGIPLITATTNSRDAKSINDVHDMLIGIGEASVGTFPQGTDIQIHEANRTDVFRVYSEFIQLNTDEISKQLVGSTMLSDQGSNRSQTEVHERTLDHKIAASDKRSITFMVNDQLLPLLQKQGYKVGEEDFFEFKTAEQEIDIDKLWNITSGLLTQGFPVEQDWISKTFNIPFEAKKNLNEKKKNEPINAVASLGEIKQRYPVSCCGNEPQAAAISSISRKLIELTKELALAVFGKKDYLGILGKLIATEGTALAAAMMKGFGKSESFTGADKLVMQMMEYNCFDFACSKTEERHYAVASRLIDYEKGAIKSKAEFLEQCLKDNQELNTNWLSTEYNLAVAVGQNSAAYVRALEDAKNGGTRFYEYQTAGDARVREAHQALDRKVFDILSPGDKAIWPPNGYGCRCEMVPHSGGAPVTDWDKGKALLIANDERYAGSQFMINRGDLKQVFTSKQFYRDIKGYPEKINQMTFDKYGLEKWEDFRNKLDELYIDKSITMRNADELFKKNISNSKMGLEDYLGKKIILTKTTFNRHKKRAELFPYVETVLKQPDEVWLVKHSKKGYQSNYIKHYKNMSLLVSTTLDETMEATQVETWFDIDYSNEHLNRRAGILIKSKKGADL
ncbi:phage portal protein family protein [Ornithobacterium rhinotracheale]|uniref:phage portal protein family protein n=3 Tax=Ornithobacterium rhinotracheale TaxID=28251 RepID=UPI004035C44F